MRIANLSCIPLLACLAASGAVPLAAHEIAGDAGPVFAERASDLQIDFPPEKQDRRSLPNGVEYLGVHGTITNKGKATVAVPTLLVVLRDAEDHIVYSWEILPTKTELAPGEILPVNNAISDPPRSAQYMEIGWKPE